MDREQAFKAYLLIKAQNFHEEVKTDLMMLKADDHLYLSDEENARRVKIPTQILKDAIERYMEICQESINKYKLEIEKL